MKARVVAAAVAVMLSGFVISIVITGERGCSLPLTAFRGRTRLLVRTNYQTLLMACHDVLSEVAAGRLGPGRYNIRWKPHGDVSRFPKAIVDLAPSYVSVVRVNDVSYLRLEMSGGFDHFGVFAYPDDFNEPFPGFSYGDCRLVDNLWYYDEGYKTDQEYRRKIDAMIKKSREGLTGTDPSIR